MRWDPVRDPTANDIALLERIVADRGAEFTIELFTSGTHDLVDADTGEPFNTFVPMAEWLALIGVTG